MSVFLGIDVGTSGTKTLAMDERGKILAEAVAGVSVLLPTATVERAGSGGLVVGDGGDDSGGREKGEAQGGRCEGNWSVGADARVGVSRQGRQCNPAGTVSGT